MIGRYRAADIYRVVAQCGSVEHDATSVLFAFVAAGGTAVCKTKCGTIK